MSLGAKEMQCLEILKRGNYRQAPQARAGQKAPSAKLAGDQAAGSGG